MKTTLVKTIGVACAILPLTLLSATREEIPFCAIRLRKPQTDSEKLWRETFEQFAKHRDAVDEVWFSTGICFPDMAEHRAHAKRLAAASADLRKVGILPSLQVQATIGHGDSFTYYADNSGITWQRYVAEDGTAAKTLNCPRAPGFLAYLREMSALYASAMRPYSVWVDDDIRIISHHGKGGSSGWGCHCQHCLDVFAAKEGVARTRTELLAGMKKDAGLAVRWRAFAFEGEAALARTIADAVHAASPETRVCQQQPGACFPEHRMLYQTYHEATGLPVGMRPGAGAYFDHDARAQIDKAYYLALQIDTIGPLPFIDRICNEIETCPRSFACRTGRGVLLEALEALSQGMNAISVLAIDAGFETPAWYGEEILAPLARNAAMLQRYVRLNVGATRCGYGVTSMPPGAMQTSSLPLKPLAPGVHSKLARLVTISIARNAVNGGKEAIQKFLDEDILLDGGAAEALVHAGYGTEIGLDGCEALKGSLRERFSDDPINHGLLARETPVAGRAFFLKPAKGARILSEYYSDANAELRPGVAAIAFETATGRRRVVFGHDAFTATLQIASGDRVRQLHRLADWASHGASPVLLETPTRSFVQPRVFADGTLASVVFVNTSIGMTPPVRLRLRGVPAHAKRAVWSSLDAADAVCDITREGDDALVTLPPIPAWTGGYVSWTE
ncbi:MAG: hypothetical protein IKR48_03690 [Kiritimatiellae bacterium]|nr:hypothetical protein [Kiritimatiellia bacterium]